MKFVCVENSFPIGSSISGYVVGEIYKSQKSVLSIFAVGQFDGRIYLDDFGYVWVNENFEYINSFYKIKFEKYNFRKEKLERILS
jgi:hypothetical protein